MPAHLRSLKRECQEPGCKKRAEVEVYNTHNALMGVYCHKHGGEALTKILMADRDKGEWRK